VGSAPKRSQRQYLLKPVLEWHSGRERRNDGQGCIPDTGFVVQFVSDKRSNDDCNGVGSAARGKMVCPELLGGEISQNLVIDPDEVVKRVVVGKAGALCDAGGRKS